MLRKLGFEYDAEVEISSFTSEIETGGDSQAVRTLAIYDSRQEAFPLFWMLAEPMGFERASKARLVPFGERPSSSSRGGS